MSRKIENAQSQSRATFFRHSAVLSLPAVLLRKLASISMGDLNNIPLHKTEASDRKYY